MGWFWGGWGRRWGDGGGGDGLIRCLGIVEMLFSDHTEWG